MATFEYSGPFSVETIGKDDIAFIDGQSYDNLPEDDSRVKTLVNIGYLKPVVQKKETKKQAKQAVQA